MAKNTIIMIGDGMGWEMARAAAISQQIEQGESGDTLSDFYTEGKGEGLSFQELENYQLSTTYGTTIADEEGVFSTGNSARLDSDELVRGPTPEQPIDAPATASTPVRPGFEFDPVFNPGTEPDGGATVEEATGNLVGYDPIRGGEVPWDPAYYCNALPCQPLHDGSKSSNLSVKA